MGRLDLQPPCLRARPPLGWAPLTAAGRPGLLSDQPSCRLWGLPAGPRPAHHLCPPTPGPAARSGGCLCSTWRRPSCTAALTGLQLASRARWNGAVCSSDRRDWWPWARAGGGRPRDPGAPPGLPGQEESGPGRGRAWTGARAHLGGASAWAALPAGPERLRALQSPAHPTGHLGPPASMVSGLGQPSRLPTRSGALCPHPMVLRACPAGRPQLEAASEQLSEDFCAQRGHGPCPWPGGLTWGGP